MLVPSTPIQKKSSCPGYWLPLTCSLPHYIFPVLCCILMFCSCITSSMLKLEEAASSKILVPVYQITGHHISEDHNVNNQWAYTLMVSAYLLFCLAYIITFFIAHRLHKNFSNWSFHGMLVQNYIICKIKVKVNLPLCRPWRPMGEWSCSSTHS